MKAFLITLGILLSTLLIIIFSEQPQKTKPFKVIDLPEEFNQRDSSDLFECDIKHDTLFIKYHHTKAFNHL